MNIGIVDYGAGNIFNVQNALKKLGYESSIIRDSDELNNLNKLIIPGVGSFGTIINNLTEQDLFNPLKERIVEGLSTLGICLGYQVLFKSSKEDPRSKGFNLIDGIVEKLDAKKIPHLGWNTIKSVKINSTFSDSYQYFVHSYFPIVEDQRIISTLTEYGIEFASAVEFDNITGCQFHPERSGEIGLNFLRRWIKC